MRSRKVIERLVKNGAAIIGDPVGVVETSKQLMPNQVIIIGEPCEYFNPAAIRPTLEQIRRVNASRND